jgi:hypothetical protein
MSVKTKNFNVFSDTKLGCTCGHEECDKRTVNQSTLNRLQVVRDKACRPLTVTSGGRCQYHPDELRRIKPADHQKCIAVDVSCKGGAERGQLVKLGIEAGFNAVGVAKTFIHLGYREGEDLVMWTY